MRGATGVPGVVDQLFGERGGPKPVIWPCMPPTSRIAPLIVAAFSEARNATALAMSCGRPTRPETLLSAIAARRSGEECSVIPVRVNPGTTSTARM